MTNKSTENSEQFQAIKVILSDGREGIFTGAVLINEGELSEELQIQDLQIFPPADMPEGMQLAQTEKEAKAEIAEEQIDGGE